MRTLWFVLGVLLVLTVIKVPNIEKQAARLAETSYMVGCREGGGEVAECKEGAKSYAGGLLRFISDTE